jgi:hypothetical protein
MPDVRAFPLRQMAKDGLNILSNYLGMDSPPYEWAALEYPKTKNQAGEGLTISILSDLSRVVNKPVMVQ